MSKIQSFIGKDAIHKTLGLVQVISRIAGSRTKVNIRCIQHADGWDEDAQMYTRIKVYARYQGTDRLSKKFQYRTNTSANDQYGFEDFCHINDLTETTTL